MDDESENQHQDNEAEPSNPRKRSRRSTQTPEERHAKKIQRDKDYRIRKNEERRGLKEENEALKKELSKINALVDELRGRLSDAFKKLKETTMENERLESEMQPLQQKILNQDDNLDPVIYEGLVDLIDLP